MSSVFSPRSNFIAWMSLAGLLVLIGGGVVVAYCLQRSSYRTRVGVVISQPVMFSHAHHVGGLGIDCRYCHSAVDKSPSAGMPSTSTCMNCHSQLWTKAPLLKPVRKSWRTGRRLHWNRVHNLPDFVFFNHSIHVNKGVGCTTCHGQIDQMPMTAKAATLYMQWCLNCHRQPEKYLRPPDKVYATDWTPPPDQASRGKKLLDRYNIHTQTLTDCSTCHR